MNFKYYLTLFLTVCTVLIYAQNKKSVYIKNYIPSKNIDLKIEEEIIKKSYPIRSITSDDYTDLQFFKKILKGKRILCLGESSHYIPIGYR